MTIEYLCENIMATYRVIKNRDNPYVLINKEFINRADISMQAKGLLTYLLSLPDDWEVRSSELPRHFTNGIKAVNTALKELINKKYIIKTQGKDAKNRFQNAQFDIHESPQN